MADQVDDYTNAIHRALTLVQFAERGDDPSTQQAITVLENATGRSQPEILSDLRRQPPNLVDADQRLQALFTSLQARADTPNADQANQALHRVLAMSRYSGLSAGPSLVSRVINAIIDAFGSLLRALGVHSPGLNIPAAVWLVIAALAILAIILWPLRAGLSRGGREARVRPSGAQARPPTDFFAEADRLAATGDYQGAIRALAGGVAVGISGERVWDHSPFTVRELFQRAPQPERLRPLLRTFEEASYGHRPPDAELYARAVEAAAPYRGKAA